MYEEICYKKPFLKEVVARVDFAGVLDVLQKSLPQKLANELVRDFPVSEPADAIARELQWNIQGVSQRETKFKQWNFFGKDREKQASLTSTFAVVSYKSYSKYEDMASEFQNFLGAITRSFPDAKAGRFGLRYINVIEGMELKEPTAWDGYFVPKLLEAISFFKDRQLLSRFINVAELKYDDLGVRFQFGMPNPDYPAAIKKPQFVLDFDGYVQTAHELADTAGHMDRAHEKIQELFESSITDRLRERMNAASTKPV